MTNTKNRSSKSADSILRMIRRAPRSEASKPIFFNLSRSSDRAKLKALLRRDSSIQISDRIFEIAKEIVKEKNPLRKLGESEKALLANQLLGASPESYGVWALFPWSNELIHLPSKDTYRWLRSRRNMYKITPAEQERLRGAKIGVVGLSAGYSVLTCLVLEGIGGEYRIADYDRLDLSNLNRLKMRCQDLGVRKTDLAARGVYETDPFASIEKFEEGITGQNIDDFLQGNGKLDLVFEECDDLYIKFKLRQEARRLGIPVVMVTADNGLVDVERFDQDRKRKLFHGLVGDVNVDSLRSMTTFEKVPIVLGILNEANMSERFSASLLEIEESLTSWPQLASDVLHGGAMAATIARRILLKQSQGSGRFYLDMDKALETPYVPSKSIKSVGKPSLPTAKNIGELLVEKALWAPSPHNSQPWFFNVTEHSLSIRLDESRILQHLDYNGIAAKLSIGCAVWNIKQLATQLGLQVTNEKIDAKQLVWNAQFDKKLSAKIPQNNVDLPDRVTNRRIDNQRGLDSTHREALLNAAGSNAQVSISICDDPSELEFMAELMGLADQVAYLAPAIHAEVFDGMRWDQAAVDKFRDGIDVETMELSPSDRAGLELVKRASRLNVLRDSDMGTGLRKPARKSVLGSCALALVAVKRADFRSVLAAGEIIQAFWTTANTLGISVHPWTTLPYMYLHMAKGRPSWMQPQHFAELMKSKAKYEKMLKIDKLKTPIFLTRLAYTGPIAKRSVRRDWREMLTTS